MANPTKSNQEKRVEKSKDANVRAAEKVAKFNTLAVKRTRKALTAINGIARLSNKGAYTYTPEQVAKIITALATAVKNAEVEFTREKSENSNGGFTL